MASGGRAVPAAVYRSRGVVEVETRQLRPPGEGEVVVEVDYCGVCGSDLHLIVEGWGTPGDVLGHEWSGRVVEVGPGVNGLAEGQAVLAGAEPTCGLCPACRAGLPSQCEARDPMTGTFDGAFASHVLSRADRLMPVPEGMDMRTAALAEPLAVALHAITRAGVSPGDSVLVQGAGPIGALCAAALVVGGHDVTVSEPAPARRALADRLGAKVVTPDALATFDMTQVDVAADPAYDVVIDTSGKAPAVNVGVQQLRRGGTLVMVGTGLERPSFDPNRMVVMELTVTGSFVYDEGGFRAALELLADPDFPTAELVEGAEYGLDAVAEAAARLADGTHAGKVMIRPGLEGSRQDGPGPEAPARAGS